MDISFFEYFNYSFVWYALIVAVLISVCASLLGVTLVLKRYSYIGDGLSHAAFGIWAVATVCNISNSMILTLPVTILFAIFLLCGGENRKIKGDASIAMVSVSALAIGYILMSVFGTSGNISGDVCDILFSSSKILYLSSLEVWLSVGLSLLVVLLVAIFYNKIFAITFDENFSKATGVKTKWLNLLLAVIVAIVIVLAMRLVGSLLVSALIVFPAISAMRLFKSFKSVTICACIISVFGAFCGVMFSLLFDMPIGATIVVFDLLIYLIFNCVALCLKGKKA